MSTIEQATYLRSVEFYKTFAQQQEKLPPHLSYAQFLKLQRQFGLSKEQTVTGFLYVKKEQLQDAGTGNAVNFFAHLAQSYYKDRGRKTISESTERTFAETIDNMLALVAELPLAETTKKESRTHRWDTDTWRLRSRFGYLDDILDQALASSQKADFETGRYVVNSKNYYEKLQPGRAAGDTRVFVEFSPSPVITPSALARGYVGNSTVFFFEHNLLTHEETVHQYWCQASWQEFGKLLKDLGLAVPENPRDVDIMQHSNFFAETELAKMKTFIAKKAQVVTEHQTEISAFIQGELRNSLEEALRDVLFTGARKLMQGKSITRESEELLITLTYAQDLLKQYISNVSRVSGRLNVIDALPSIPITPPVFEANAEARREHVAQFGLKLLGCGVNTNPLGDTKYELATVHNASLGELLMQEENAVLHGFEGEDQFGERSFPCPNCKQNIDRDIGELKDVCPHCHEPIPC